MTPRSARRQYEADALPPQYGDELRLDVLEQTPRRATKGSRAGVSRVATEDVQPQARTQQRNVKYYNKIQLQDIDTEDDIPVTIPSLQPRHTTGIVVARKRSALQNRVSDRQPTTGDFPQRSAQVHRQNHSFGVRDFFSLVYRMRFVIAGIFLAWALWWAGTGVQHWWAGNQYAASGSTHGAQMVAFVGDGDSADKPDTVYALLNNGQVFLVTGNNPEKKMHIYVGPSLSTSNMVSLEVSVTGPDGHKSIVVKATDWEHLNASVLVIKFISDGKGGLEGGQ